MIKSLKDIPNVVYHGTISSYRGQFDQIKFGRELVDFGRGFYTTSNYNQASTWARSVTNDYYRFELKPDNDKKPLVVSFTLDKKTLENLNVLIFAEDCSKKWAEFVYNNRIDDENLFSDFHNRNSIFDLCYGYVADTRIPLLIRDAQTNKINFETFCAKLKPLRPKTDDQISFHTESAISGLKIRKEEIDNEYVFKG